jgi:hypothetical protein
MTQQSQTALRIAGPAAEFDGWVPVRLRWQDGQPLLRWLRLGTVRYAEPFFDLSVRHCLSTSPGGLEWRETGLDVLLEAQRRHPVPPPAGFIFHMSRCGSTLVAQLLAALPGAVVLSEAEPVDGMLAAHLHDATLDEARRIALLQAMVGVLGRSGGGGPVFVKFDAWHICSLPLIRRAFPGVPWVFLCRDPLQVLRSHQRERGGHMVPGLLDARLLGFAPGKTSLDDYGAAVLQRICAAAGAALDEAGLVIDYAQLPDAVWQRLLPHFQLPWDHADEERMRQVAARNAKEPWEAFDPARRRRAPAAPQVPAALRQAYAHLLAAAGAAP